MNLRFLGEQLFPSIAVSHARKIFHQLRIARDESQHLLPVAQNAESKLRTSLGKRVERVAKRDIAEEADANLAIAFARWTQTTRALQLNTSRAIAYPKL